MPAENEFFRVMEAAEVETLGPMPVADEVTPTTDRDGRAPRLTAEVHSPGVVRQSSAYGDDDRIPPPRSLTEED